MKQVQNLVFAIIIIALIGFTGCEKENFINNGISYTTNSDIKVIYYNNKNNEKTSMLAFKDLSTFQKTVQDLSSKLKEYDDAFNKEYSHLNEEEINKVYASSSFDKNKPLKDFEKKLGYKSALSDYLDDEKIWLSTPDLTEELDPDVLYNYLNEEEVVLLSKDLAVKIGNDIIIQKEDGKAKIINGDLKVFESTLQYKKLSQIRGISDDKIEFQYFNNGDIKTSCAYSRTNKTYWNNGKRYKMKGKTRFTSNDYWLGSQVYVKTKYYKKGWTGIWHGYRTSIRASMNGIFDAYLPVPDVQVPCGTGSNIVYNNVHFTYSSNSDSVNYSIYFNPYMLVQVPQGMLIGNHQASSLNMNQSFY